jgi:hypothetical protein
MNDLEKYFRQNNRRLIDKWVHYFDIYERHFQKYRNKEIVIVEIGVSHGGSLQMWKDYFGSKAKIYGVDINSKCKDFEEENIQIFIGSQSDRTFLRQILTKIPKIDILIDDGGHSMAQQIITFEEMFAHIKEDGTYLCEDNHTSYWLRWGGGYKRRGTFIEYSKNFIDYIHAFHTSSKSLRVNSFFNNLKVNSFTKSVNSLHYYDSILVIEKQSRQPPHNEITGVPSFEAEIENDTFLKKIYKLTLAIINVILRFFRLNGFIWK